MVVDRRDVGGDPAGGLVDLGRPGASECAVEGVPELDWLYVRGARFGVDHEHPSSRIPETHGRNEPLGQLPLTWRRLRVAGRVIDDESLRLCESSPGRLRDGTEVRDRRGVEPDAQSVALEGGEEGTDGLRIGMAIADENVVHVIPPLAILCAACRLESLLRSRFLAIEVSDYLPGAPGQELGMQLRLSCGIHRLWMAPITGLRVQGLESQPAPTIRAVP